MADFDKREIGKLMLYHFAQAQDLSQLFHWMLQKEKAYGIFKKELFRDGLESLDEKLGLQHALVKKLLTDLKD